MGDRSTARNSSRKTRRNPRACDKCSSKSVKCYPSTRDPSRCQNCKDYDEACTFDRPTRKRGARPKVAQVATSHSDGRTDENATGAASTRLLYQSGAPVESCGAMVAPLTAVRQSSTASTKPLSGFPQALIMDLTEIFFEVVYPVFPLFHKPSLTRRVARAEHNTCQPFYASVMAMCALSSARARDGALYTQTWSIQTLQEPSSEAFFEAAQQAIPTDAPLIQSFDYMRASVLLAICAIQYGKTPIMNHYLGIYHAFVAVGALHDEVNWPKSPSAIDLEERRRLFWSTYTLDIFTSVVWGGTVRSREASSNVQYPRLADDEISQDTAPGDHTNLNCSNWLQGWNFLTDLYRILEHAVDDLRRFRTLLDKTPALPALSGSAYTEPATVLDQVVRLYNDLPDCFRNTRPATGKLETDLYSFQAANIAATMQLLRMVYFTRGFSTLEQKCQVASEVIAGFATVPVAYLRAISAPLLHHLAEIGAILGAAFGEGMTESSYRRIRSVLLDLADLLSTLEVDLFCSPGSSQKLRSLVSPIDEFMDTMRQRQCVRGNAISETRAYGEADALNAMAVPPHQITLSQPALSPEFHIPPELLEDWSWTFDFTTAST